MTLLTGETGLGKTLLVQALLADLSKNSEFSPCLISDPRGETAVILNQLVQVFQPPPAIEDPWHAFWAGVDQTRSTGSSAIVIVDDAHLLSNEGAAILGKLATGDRARTIPVPVLLVGQPTTVRRLNLPAFRLLKGASSDASIDLGPLSPDEVGPYIDSRLQKAGAPADNDIFAPETVPMIADATGGVPRQINKLCEVCLFLAGESKATSITAESLRQTLVIYDDMEVPGQHDALDDQSAPSDVIVLQEPQRQQVDTPLRENPLLSPPVSPAGPRRGSSRAAKPRKGRRGTGFAILGIVAIAVIYVLSPFGPLPADNAIMVALYGAPPVTSPADRSVATESDVERTQPTAEPDITALPALQRTFDPVADPAGPYYDAAIASTGSQEIAVAYSRAAIRGHTRSALYLGQLFETGDGVTFAPDVAAQWYAVAEDAALLDKAVSPRDLANGGAITPLFSAINGTMAEFIWEGNAAMFRLEIGDADGNPIAQFTTPLTAALVEIPPDAVLWRVQTSEQSIADWIPIGDERNE
ncbi:ExeA family protein [Yoonia sp. 2307UL14-13]|uniref:ExeA family protein n=1 Tax=Yoonia sp. 2307UL14-13 TaxID=3126506 RepID=UPI0030A66C86